MFDKTNYNDPMVALHILVVDADPDDLLASTQVIAEAGHIPEGANSSTQAIELAYKVPYDVILMDIHLPGINGLETTKIIRALPDGRGSLPIIALTLTSDPLDVKNSFAAGMNNFILKPLTADNLHSAISAYAFKKRKYALAQNDK